MQIRSVGFPCARHEAGEVREFLPPLLAFLGQFELQAVVVEAGYGSRMGLSPEAYDAACPVLRRGTRDEAFGQDLVITLRCPAEEDLRRLKRGAVILSMLHFPTRPLRVQLMETLGVTGVAMDQIADDLGRRLIENLESVGFNGVKVAMQALAARWPQFKSAQRGPLRVTVLGAGAVGAHAVRAAARYGDDTVRAALREARVPGVVVTVLDTELTQDAPFLEATLAATDLLVDATQRRDTSQPVVRNVQLAKLPEHAVVVDLSVDPYDFARSPPSVKGLEGIPQGNLDQYVFPPGDPAWAALDARVPHAVQRTAVSCYSWPGIEPISCMNVYGKQLEPVVRALLTRGTALPETGGVWVERATARALHTRFLKGTTP